MFSWTEPNSFWTKSEFFQKAEQKPNQNKKKSILHIPTYQLYDNTHFYIVVRRCCCTAIWLCDTVCCYCSQRILPLPNDGMFARSSSANRLSASPQQFTRHEMPRSTSNIASAASADAVIAAFDPFVSARYAFCFINVYTVVVCPYD